MDNLSLVKRLLNIDFDDDDDLLSVLIDSAKVYLLEAGVEKNKSNEKLYNLTLSLLVRQLYEDKEREKPNLNISNLLHMLRWGSNDKS